MNSFLTYSEAASFVAGLNPCFVAAFFAMASRRWAIRSAALIVEAHDEDKLVATTNTTNATRRRRPILSIAKWKTDYFSGTSGARKRNGRQRFFSFFPFVLLTITKSGSKKQIDLMRSAVSSGMLCFMFCLCD